MDLAVWGFVGGVAAEGLRWFRIRDELHKGVPAWGKSWLYWIVTAVMSLIGAGLVWAYDSAGDVQLNPIVAINIGASAPLIISRVTSQLPPSDPGTFD